MAQDFSLHKFFKNQYLEEALDRSSSKYVTPTTGIKTPTSEYITDKRKSNAEKETNAMRRPDFEMYDQEDGTRQSYISDEDLMDDEYIQENRARVSMPRFVKDKNNPNFLNVYIDYDLGGGGAAIALGKETMTGQIRRESAAKAMRLAGDVAKNLEAQYNLEDIDIQDLENGKVNIFAVSDDFIDIDPSTLNEMDMNDPVVMKMRAQQDQYDKELEKSIEPKVDFDEVLDLRDEKGDLERRIKNLYREMENDPDIEGEGGAVADQYGDELNKLETRLYKVIKQINQYDMNESLNESLNPEVSKVLDRFIKAMAKRYSYSEQDAVFAIQAALKQRDADGVKEGSCGYTPDGKPRKNPAGPNLLKLKETVFSSFKK